ncbi:thiol-disulfide isomerase/thioredoxin [Mycoplana sp. BE70]|uniref:TlpA disulfide reductase family protein n=1 Tax=Mycoplana sp. BE70 TaxID=2817775 RepID=UPI00285B0C2F|nr:TlpA disulfide reductase family protein [Mycoplana sp. BE70]MDR6759180.1 thiol-disulfide isomerase/thioredoxin [Mycoplana sp. BE70]
MNAVAIGPLAFSADRLSVITGLIVFMAVGSLLAARVDNRLGTWTTSAALSGIVGARVMHVLTHAESFLQDPWQVLAIWQGGFSSAGGFIGVLLVTVMLWRKAPPAAPWTIMPLAAGLFAWVAATTLTDGSAAPRAPETSHAVLAQGETISIADRKGRPAVLNLWASWCPPCRREMPMMAEMAGSNPQVDFLFANQGEGREAIATYLRQAGVDLETILLDPFADLSRHYGALGLPATLFINPDGTLSASHLGEISREALAERLAALSPQDRTQTE